MGSFEGRQKKKVWWVRHQERVRERKKEEKGKKEREEREREKKIKSEEREREKERKREKRELLKLNQTRGKTKPLSTVGATNSVPSSQRRLVFTKFPGTLTRIRTQIRDVSIPLNSTMNGKPHPEGTRLCCALPFTE